MKHELRARISALWVAVVVLLAMVLPALANSGPTSRNPGPGGLIPQRTDAVRIESEQLTVDMIGEDGLPPAGYTGTAHIVAEYDLQNVTGNAVTLNLVYVSPGTRTFTATLNSQVLAVEPATIDPAAVPSDWKVPANALDPLGGEYDLSHSDINYNNLTPYAFEVSIGANQRASLHMEADQQLGFDSSRHLNVINNIVYLLAPARNWAGFGILNVKLIVPPDYIVASDPKLSKQSADAQSAVYTGSFNGIPADTLRVSIMSNRNLWVGSTEALTILPGALLGLMFGVIGYLLGHIFVRNRRSGGWEATLSGCLGIFIAVLLTTIGCLVVGFIVMKLFDYPQFAGGYSIVFGIFFGLVLGIILAVVISFFGGLFYLIRHRHRPV